MILFKYLFEEILFNKKFILVLRLSRGQLGLLVGLELAF